MLLNKTASTEEYACPACLRPLRVEGGESLYCKGCDRQYSVVDDIPWLITDEELGTQLEEIDYDPVDEQNIARQSKSVFAPFARNLAENGVKGGVLLELGCGTGFLSYGLAEYSGFERIVCTDVSHNFLKLTRQRVSGASRPERFSYLRCDANHLPYNAPAFDAVMGNAILHHLIDYPLVVENVFRILRPGGVAVFSEPTMQGHRWVGAILALVADLDMKSKKPRFTPRQHNALKAYLRMVQRKRDVLREERETMEDKYLFDVPAEQERFRAIGFSDVRFVSLTPKSLREQIINKSLGASRQRQAPIEDHPMLDTVLEWFNDSYEMFADTMCPPFGQFVLVK